MTIDQPGGFGEIGDPIEQRPARPSQPDRPRGPEKGGDQVVTPDSIVVWDEGLQEREERAPSEDRVRQLIAELDGRLRTLVTLYRGGAHLAVGGDAEHG